MELRKYKLGDVLELQRGFDLSSSQMKNGDVAVVGSNGIIGYHNLPRGNTPCITIGRSGSVGKVHYYTQKTWAHNTTLFVKDFKENDPKYLYYFLKNLHLDEIFGKSSSVVPSLDRKIVHALVVPFYKDVCIQKSISSVLSNIDSKIELNRAINDNLAKMAKQLYDYWFVQFDFPDEIGRPYKSSGGEMVWNDKLKREIPCGWYCGTLLDIAEYTNGLACQRFRPIDDNKLPVVKIKEMHDGLSSDTEWVRSDIPESVKVYDGDVLFSWSASLEVMLWAYGNGGLNQHIFKVTSKNGFPRSFYFYQLIDYIGNFKRMAEARKTTMGHITQDHLKQSTIALPQNIDIANKLEERLCPIFYAIVKNCQEIMTLTKQRDELLPLLMNGQASLNYHLSEWHIGFYVLICTWSMTRARHSAFCSEPFSINVKQFCHCFWAAQMVSSLYSTCMSSSLHSAMKVRNSAVLFCAGKEIFPYM